MFTPYGKLVKCALIQRDRTQKWLIGRVREETGLYFDSAYLNRILTGVSHSSTICGAIDRILDMKEGSYAER